MTDIVERLRAHFRLNSEMMAERKEAADEIERLRGEVERLLAREATEAPVRELIRQDARSDALEEAAKVADGEYFTADSEGIFDGPYIAAAIRALKENTGEASD